MHTVIPLLVCNALWDVMQLHGQHVIVSCSCPSEVPRSDSDFALGRSEGGRGSKFPRPVTTPSLRAL